MRHKLCMGGLRIPTIGLLVTSLPLRCMGYASLWGHSGQIRGSAGTRRRCADGLPTPRLSVGFPNQEAVFLGKMAILHMMTIRLLSNMYGTGFPGVWFYCYE
ncbi:hypothetical protein GGS26DRAFT_33813 [Hypomontagnella submonticulosa]|nr:hypothetical protein GGS26DRAFT_33813 [Hypomontagnella submonticulosa]